MADKKWEERMVEEEQGENEGEEFRKSKNDGEIDRERGREGVKC